MNYVRLCKSKYPVRPKDHEMYKPVHAEVNGCTLCGKRVNGMWLVIGNSDNCDIEVTCGECKKQVGVEE